MAETSLLGGKRITGGEVRRAQFPSAIIGGYRVQDVEKFRARVAGELELVHRALDDTATERQEFLREIERLNSRLAYRPTGPMPAMANSERAIDILMVAQQQADKLVADAKEEARRIVGDARRDIGQMTEHARQQADAFMNQARQEGTNERARIIDGATAEARRQVDFLVELGRTIRGGLGGQVEDLLAHLSEWDRMVHDGAA
jgi:vacuolar-type H+-ATPase subunit H